MTAFRQRDVTRLVRAIESAGLKVKHVKVEADGSISVELVPSADGQTTPAPDLNPWAEVYKDDFKL